MVKRKLKQRTGDLTVIVNVGGVPTKKVRKKRGKSRARGGGSVRPAKNFVVSYTDQTPTLNLLKEFSETNRLLLTGQNNLAPALAAAPAAPARLAAPAAPARLAAQTSEPSVMGTAYSIDTTRPIDTPRPNRLAPAPLAPDPPRPSRPVVSRPAPRGQAAESQDLSGFRKLASHFRGRPRGKPEIMEPSKQEVDRQKMRNEDKASRKMPPPLPPRPERLTGNVEAISTMKANLAEVERRFSQPGPPALAPLESPPVSNPLVDALLAAIPTTPLTRQFSDLEPPPALSRQPSSLDRPPLPRPPMVTRGEETLPQRPPPNRSTFTNTEPPPNMSIGTNTDSQRPNRSTFTNTEPPPNMSIGTNTDAQRPVVQKLPDPKPRMTTTGAETLPQQASPATQEATRLARELAADIGKTKAELKKTKAELAKMKDDTAEEAEMWEKVNDKAMKVYIDERDKAKDDLEQMKQTLRPNMVSTGTEMPPNMVSTGTGMPPPNRSTQFTNTESPPNMSTGTNTDPPNRSTQFTNTESPPNMSTGTNTDPPLPSMDRVFSELTRTRQAREFAMESGKTKAQLRAKERELENALKDLNTAEFYVEVEQKANKIYSDERDKARADLERSQTDYYESQAARQRAKERGHIELELERQARAAAEDELMELYRREADPVKESLKEKKVRLTREREERASRQSEDEARRAARQLKAAREAQAEDIDDDSPEKALAIRKKVMDQQMAQQSAAAAERSSSEESVGSMEDYDRLQRFSKQAVDADMNQYDEDDPNYKQFRKEAVAKEWAKTKAYSSRPLAGVVGAMNRSFQERLAPQKRMDSVEPKPEFWDETMEDPTLAPFIAEVLKKAPPRKRSSKKK